MIRIWAGYAMSRDRFVVSVGELNDEQPRSVTLSYNAVHEMKWGYADLQRTIKSVTALPDGGQGKPLFLALSNEGEVFHLTGAIPNEKILGAGVWSDDAEGWGSTVHIQRCEDRIYVCGYGSQVYERLAKDRWSRICDRDSAGVDDSAFLGMACRPGTGLVAVCGFKRTQYSAPSPEEQSRIDRTRAAGDDAGARLLEDRARRIAVPKSSCLYFRDGTGWREAVTNSDGALNDCCVRADGSVVAVGDHGVMVRAAGPDDVEDVSVPDMTDNLYSVAEWQGGLSVLGASGLHLFGADLSLSQTVELPEGLSLPNRHQVVGDDIFYIDYGGLAFYRGGEWARVAIPDDMWRLAGG